MSVLTRRLRAVAEGLPHPCLPAGCLHCGAFVTDWQHGRGPAAAAPLIRRGKELRSELLRMFAVEIGPLLNADSPCALCEPRSSVFMRAS